MTLLAKHYARFKTSRAAVQAAVSQRCVHYRTGLFWSDQSPTLGIVYPATWARVI